MTHQARTDFAPSSPPASPTVSSQKQVPVCTRRPQGHKATSPSAIMQLLFL
uniref:Uncharacterized protein n=1 Tax=Anguilla anguilla TaxID=7936 RepID=A0A0E9VAN5_ANGAN